MRKVLAVVAICGTLSAVASADNLSPISAYAGYFSSLSFNNRAGFSTHLGGLELGAQESLLSLPIFGSATLGASVVLGDSLGGGSSGTLYRVHLDYKTATAPGTNFYAIAALGYYYATGSGFNVQNGLGAEVGVGIPLKLGPSIGPGAAIEARYRFLGPTAASGFSIGLNVSF